MEAYLRIPITLMGYAYPGGGVPSYLDRTSKAAIMRVVKRAGEYWITNTDDPEGDYGPYPNFQEANADVQGIRRGEEYGPFAESKETEPEPRKKAPTPKRKRKRKKSAKKSYPKKR